ncbi:sugar ABC transporter permease [Candidatus Bipolaricaulota bacterium]|nr:sugar ABC transporter permease [Candidatus Bipolaricaulota bacterium]
MFSSDNEQNSPLNDIAGRFTPYVYLGPTLIAVGLFLLYPLFSTFGFSFFSWDGFSSMEFVGFANYLELGSDPKFWSALVTNLIYILFFSIIPTIFGLLIASLIGRTQVKGTRYFRTIFFIPQIIPSVALGTIFSWIYAPRFGVLQGILKSIGLESWSTPWLGSPDTAPYAVGLIGTWLWTGFSVIIFLAGIQKIDEYLYDAAKIDGANVMQQFFYVTLPELRYEIVVVIIMTMIRALSTNVFGIVDAITGGANSTRPISLYAYELAFVQNKVGYAASIIVILAIIVFTFSGITMFTGESS